MYLLYSTLVFCTFYLCFNSFLVNGLQSQSMKTISINFIIHVFVLVFFLTYINNFFVCFEYTITNHNTSHTQSNYLEKNKHVCR